MTYRNHSLTDILYADYRLPEPEPVQPVQPRPRRRAKRPAGPPSHAVLPFVAVDGEGIRRGAEHKYALLRIGTEELYHSDRRLTTPQCLAFILTAPRDAILTAFAFEYDITMILKDVPHGREHPDIPSRLERLLTRERANMEGRSSFGANWTWLNFNGFPPFGVDWMPRNHLKVCLAEKHGKRTRCKAGSMRVIYDAFSFFQSSFLKAINAWNIRPEYWEEIKDMKQQRSAFDAITPQIRAYCQRECECHAELMEAFRAACLAADVIPKTWNGPGKMATYKLNQHGIIKREEVKKHVPPGALAFAHHAYYGGRFEITACGKIRAAVNEFDITSAYPAAMKGLPCLEHGRWRRATTGDIRRLYARSKSALFVCRVHFRHQPDQFLCGLPLRDAKTARLAWPIEGNGIYWSPEIRSAERLGADCELKDGWVYEKRCRCVNFTWVEQLFAERLRVGKDTGKGRAYKLVYNSLYGKLAQRIGYAAFANPVWAGLITALTRAKLNDAIAGLKDPRHCLMIATDAIYTVGEAAKVESGKRLGQWEKKVHPSLFIVRPGLWWPERPDDLKTWKLKSRGIAARFFEQRTGEFEDVFRRYAEAAGNRPFADEWFDPEPVPKVAVKVDMFIGLRLAWHRAFTPARIDKHGVAHEAKLNLDVMATAGTWIEADDRHVSFDWSDKRQAGPWAADLSHRQLLPLIGGDVESMAYNAQGLKELPSSLAEERMAWEAMPDMIDFSPPHTDD